MPWTEPRKALCIPIIVGVGAAGGHPHIVAHHRGLSIAAQAVYQLQEFVAGRYGPLAVELIEDEGLASGCGLVYVALYLQDSCRASDICWISILLGQPVKAVELCAAGGGCAVHAKATP